MQAYKSYVMRFLANFVLGAFEKHEFSGCCGVSFEGDARTHVLCHEVTG